MASDKSFVDFIVDQIENFGQITYGKIGKTSHPELILVTIQ